ncbi:hypothetical protein ACNE9Y_31190, partial [Pseudomonas sp. NY11226]|uniref:hypothetical protein n=1 Tax=Pseudomonas sp. NY11226 TaxID=3400362 RepID=UPI003A869C57
LDRFDFEFFGVTLTTHDTSYLGLIMRLGGVYETRGDSDISVVTSPVRETKRLNVFFYTIYANSS